MIRRPTVFILGAGASMDFGLPSGMELVNQILELAPGSTDSNRWISEFEKLGFAPGHLEEMRISLHKSHHRSIDSFLERRDKFINIGKRAIAHRLLPREIESQLLKTTVKGNQPNWYQVLLGRLTEDTQSLNDVATNNVAFVTFNYDRTLEHYLFTTLLHHYETTRQEVVDVLKKIPIIHVHGQLGQLPWQAGNGEVVDFGESNIEAVEKAAKSIKIVSEMSSSPLTAFEQAHGYIADAKAIFILGFGYLKQNMQRLKIPFMTEGPNWPGGRPRAIYGTCHKITAARRTVLGKEWNGLGLYDATIPEFLENNERFLTDIE